MKIELANHDIEPLVRQVVLECLRQVHAQSDLRPRGDKTPAPAKLLLNSAEAAKLLGISERTLWELKRTGQIPYVPMGNGGKRDNVRYAVSDLLEFIERRKRTGSDPDTIHEETQPPLPR